MTMHVPYTEQNAALAQRVNARLVADSRIVSAKAAFWRLSGVGACGGLLLAGFGLALLGYARVADVRSSADQIAGALSTALAKTTLRTDGEVRLDTDRVKLDTTDATVRLREGSRVGVEGTVGIQPGSSVGVRGDAGQGGGDMTGVQRAVDRLRNDLTSRNGAKVVRAYTIFNQVAYGTGQVVTGWKYNNSNDASPESQYCYYDQKVSGANVRIDIAQDGHLVPVQNSPRGFRSGDAATNCIWFNGETTRD